MGQLDLDGVELTAVGGRSERVGDTRQALAAESGKTKGDRRKEAKNDADGAHNVRPRH